MPRYYFDIQRGGLIAHDDGIGEEHPDLDAAKAEAEAIAAALTCEYLPSDDYSEIMVRVLNENRMLLALVTSRLLVEPPRPRGAPLLRPRR